MTGQSLKAMVESIEASIERVDSEHDVGQDLAGFLDAPREGSTVPLIQASGCDVEGCTKIISDSAHAPSVGRRL